jgi:hypothetical protein
MTEKFISPELPPEGLDRELLTVLAEECCEVGQRVAKALRFGIAEIQPGQPLSNARRISDELGDLLGVMDRLMERGVLSDSDIEIARDVKRIKLERFLQS